MSFTWDPERYLTYADERTRPFLDLLARVDDRAPRTVLDLGCGAGNLTALLAERWPEATIAGLDSSEEMIARARADHPSLAFWVEDLRHFLASDAAPVDVLLSNATLQWVPGHLDLMPSLVAHVSPGGWLGFQVPGNFDQPSHTIRAELAAGAPYAEHLHDIAEPASQDPADYLDALSSIGCQVDAWETTYLHVLQGDDPVFTWVSGTGARPTLEALEAVGLREDFEAEFKQRLAKAYPDTGRGVVLPFRRVFVVAQMPA
jgi:trans-aconitate 2-methyltransferase